MCMPSTSTLASYRMHLMHARRSSSMRIIWCVEHLFLHRCTHTHLEASSISLFNLAGPSLVCSNLSILVARSSQIDHVSLASTKMLELIYMFFAQVAGAGCGHQPDLLCKLLKTILLVPNYKSL